MHGLNNSYLYAAKRIETDWNCGKYSVTSGGTGFFVNKDDELFFVTNRHVIEPGYGHPQFAGYIVSGFRFESFQTTDKNGVPVEMETIHVQNWNDFKYANNENDDVACIRNIAIESNEKEIVINQAIPFELLATNEWLSSKLSVCDTIAYPGFPEWYDHYNNTPIIRMGTIASDPRLNYSYKANAPEASRIAYEGFSSGGASGSPVFSTQNGFRTGAGINAPDDFFRQVMLIGINAGHFDDQKGHSGISYMYKSSVIIDIINSF